MCLHTRPLSIVVLRYDLACCLHPRHVFAENDLEDKESFLRKFIAAAKKHGYLPCFVLDGGYFDRTRDNLDAVECAYWIKSNKKTRGLDEAKRIALAEECSAWTDWLEGSIAARTIPDARRTTLTEELQLLRYDLLKSSGF